MLLELKLTCSLAKFGHAVPAVSAADLLGFVLTTPPLACARAAQRSRNSPPEPRAVALTAPSQAFDVSSLVSGQVGGRDRDRIRCDTHDEASDLAPAGPPGFDAVHDLDSRD